MGNGRSINLWLFNWCYQFPLYNLIPHDRRKALNLEAKVSDIISNSSWNFDSLANVLPAEALQVIQTIHISYFLSEDYFVWGPTGNETLCIKSAANLFKS